MRTAEKHGGSHNSEHYEQERGPDGSLELFRWTDQDRKTLGKKKLDEIINRWRESVKKGEPDGE